MGSVPSSDDHHPPHTLFKWVVTVAFASVSNYQRERTQQIGFQYGFFDATRNQQILENQNMSGKDSE